MTTYILFYSSNYTFWAENVLKDAGIECKSANVPKQISSECGSCLIIPYADIPKALDILKLKHVPIDRVETL